MSTLYSMSAPSFYVPAIYTGTAVNRPMELLSSGLCPSGGDYLIVKVQSESLTNFFPLLPLFPFRLPRSIEFQCLLKVCPSSQGRKSNLWGVIVYFLDLLFGIFCGKIGKSDFVNPSILFCPLGFSLSLGTPILYHKVTVFAIGNCTK